MEKQYAWFDPQKQALEKLSVSMPAYHQYACDAAIALALHNIKIDWNDAEQTELNQRGVTIEHFCIPIAKAPIAYLLRLCDELQCWDRQQFSEPTGYSFAGDKLEFDPYNGNAMVSLSIYDIKERNKIQEALKDLFDPPIQGIIDIHG